MRLAVAASRVYAKVPENRAVFRSADVREIRISGRDLACQHQLDVDRPRVRFIARLNLGLVRRSTDAEISVGAKGDGPRGRIEADGFVRRVALILVRDRRVVVDVDWA